jgi:ABC-type transport system involved in cytochrome c biogenesis permease subunit
LGLWFTLLPLFGRGLQYAWRLTALPGTWEAGPLDEAQTNVLRPEAWKRGNLLLLLPRLALAAAIFYALTMTGYGSERSYVPLSPKTAQVSDLIVWGVGLAVLAIAVYYVPRIALAAAAALVMAPRVLRKEGLARPLEQVLSRKAFVVAGAAVAFFAAYLAYFVPGFDRNIFDKHINPLMPVLRDNFWLTTHVLTITASYGAGLLAWGLGNLALGWYLFGRYRRSEGGAAPAIAGEEHRPAGRGPVGRGHLRPPEVSTTLGTYIYKASQVAVLLLAAGTILGALWADVSWGRFWGWDPKEVWALIALLIYLAVLHGRYAGLFGNFGLAIGSVIGQTSILMAWYGVNFVLGSGLHSYGDGAGGKWWVFAFIGLNWAFAAAAAFRYFCEVQFAARRPNEAELLAPGAGLPPAGARG